MLIPVRTPSVFLPKVWPLPISLATTFGISFDFSSSAYLDVSVQRVPFANLWIQLTMHGSSPCGFPHSEIRGSKLISSSPRLIAGNHVLHRLSVPRHSPYALFRLNSSLGSLSSSLYCLSFANNCWVVNFFSQKTNFFHTNCCAAEAIACSFDSIVVPTTERPSNLLKNLSHNYLFRFFCALFGFQ